MAALIRAAGGVVWRPDGDGQVEVCLVHRPRYDDWSLPKGKLGPGEHPLRAAVREVWEETGVAAVPLARLPRIRYRVRDGAPKLVDYWTMRADAVADFQPGPEVDAVAWLPAERAARRVNYRHDAELLQHFADLPPVTAAVLLVRHGHAGRRRGWPGPDGARPLTRQGRAESLALQRLLELFAPIRLVSATPRRCLQTIAGLAAQRDLPVTVESAFDDTAAHTDRAAVRVLQLAASAPSTVVCSQGAVIRPVLARLTGTRASLWRTAKGDGWLLPFSGPLPLRPDPLRPMACHDRWTGR